MKLRTYYIPVIPLILGIALFLIQGLNAQDLPPFRLELLKARTEVNKYMVHKNEPQAIALLDSLVQRFKNEPDSIILRYGITLGTEFRDLHRHDKASLIYSLVQSVAKQHNDSSKLCTSYYYLGLSYKNLGLANRGLVYLFQGLSLSEQINDVDRNAQILLLIGNIKKEQNLLIESIDFFERALKLSLQIQGEELTSSIYNNLGSAYKKSGDYARAKEYFLASLEINKRTANVKNLSYNYNNLANVYEETGELDNAIIYHQKSIDLKIELGDKPSLAYSYSNMALVYIKKREFATARGYVEKAIQLAKEYHVAYILPVVYQQQADIFKEMGDFRNALESITRMNAVKDSLDALDKEAIINEMEAKYEQQLLVNENELLRKDIQLSESEIYRKDAFLWILGICVGMLLIVLVSYYFSYKNRLEANIKLKEQNAAILAQKQRIENQKIRIEESTKSLEQVRQDKEVFFSTISHDMRGPLNAINAIVSIMKGETEKPSEELMVLDYSAQSLNALVEDILDFSNLESGRLQIEQRTFSIHDLLTEIAHTFQFISNEKEVDLIVEMTGSTEKMMGDQRRIRQVIFNLLGNAFKFTKEGFVKMTLQIDELDSMNHSIFISVQDTGIGIHENKLDVIFNKFTQASREIYKDFGGSGLGLFISKILIEQMKGTLTVHSKVGEGTVFEIRLTLPVVRQIQA